MNSLQIEYFLEVVKQESFTKASRVLYISQPSISRQIANLEAEIGIPLFDRTKTGAKLTPGGRMFYDLFKRFIREIEDTSLKASQMIGETMGHLEIGFVEGWDLRQLAKSVMEKFIKEYKNFEIEFRTYTYKELLAQLQANVVDGIICPKALVETNQNIQYINLVELRNVLLFSSRHAKPLNGSFYTQDDFVNQKLYILSKEETPVAREFCNSYFRSKGLAMEVQEIHNRDSMLFEISMDHGYAIFDVWTRAIKDPEFQYMKLDIAMPICFAWKKNNDNQMMHIFANELLFYMNQMKQQRAEASKRKAVLKELQESDGRDRN